MSIDSSADGALGFTGLCAWAREFFLEEAEEGMRCVTVSWSQGWILL